MKEQLADYSDVIVARIRPRDRITGSQKRRLHDPIELRVAHHTLSESLGPDLEKMFALVMKPLPEYQVEVAKRKAALLEREQQQLREQQEEATAKSER